MSEQPETLTPEQAGVVKAAAALWYKEKGIRPATADYIFERYMRKRAIEAGLVAPPSPEPKEKATKLAEALRPIIAKVKAAKKD